MYVQTHEDIDQYFSCVSKAVRHKGPVVSLGHMMEVR
jgi:hypothetical protein